MDRLVTESKAWVLGEDEIKVEISDTDRGSWYRLVVNGSCSAWEKDDTQWNGPLIWACYGVATPFWEGLFRPFVPFKLSYAKEA